jgi:hypothetical protein
VNSDALNPQCKDSTKRRLRAVGELEEIHVHAPSGRDAAMTVGKRDVLDGDSHH